MLDSLGRRGELRAIADQILISTGATPAHYYSEVVAPERADVAGGMDLASLSNALQELSILAREAKRGQGEHGEGAHEEGRAAEEQMLKTQALVLDEIQRVEEMIDAHAHAGGHEAAAAARRVAHMVCAVWVVCMRLRACVRACVHACVVCVCVRARCVCRGA